MSCLTAVSLDEYNNAVSMVLDGHKTSARAELKQRGKDESQAVVITPKSSHRGGRAVREIQVS